MAKPLLRVREQRTSPVARPDLQDGPSAVADYLADHGVEQKSQRPGTAPSVDRGKKKALQEVVDVQRKGAYVPPGGVGAEAAGGDVPASKLVLQFVFSRCGFRLFLKTRAPFRMHLWESIESLHG